MNDYKLPHLRKDRIIREKSGPTAIRCSEAAIEAAKVKLEELTAKQEMLRVRKRLLAKQQQSSKKTKSSSMSDQQPPVKKKRLSK